MVRVIELRSVEVHEAKRMLCAPVTGMLIGELTGDTPRLVEISGPPRLLGF
jgi:hypothetical protein